MTRTIGYIVTDGQFKDRGKHVTKELFTGGILIPDGIKANIVYNKLKDDIFKRATDITSIDSEDTLIQTFKSLYEVAFEQGASHKYSNMHPQAKQRFDNK